MWMRGGRDIGDGPRQLAALFILMLLGVFFLLAARTVWDRMHGAPDPISKGPINPREYQKKALQGRWS